MHRFASAPQAAVSGEQSMLPDISGISLPATLASRKAKIQDVDGMSSLINEFASARIMLARGPLYLYQNIQDYRVITVNAGEKEIVLACGGLHVLWEDLAEVRSVAVHPQLQHKGIGRLLVQDLIEDARARRGARIHLHPCAGILLLPRLLRRGPRHALSRRVGRMQQVPEIL